MIETVRLTGPQSGPTVLILGGVHGEEKPGWMSVERLIASGPKLERGTALLTPRVNALAVSRGLHHIDENLNRIVRRHESPRTHEQKLANELIALIDSADVVLDMHGAPAPTVPFAFLDDEAAPNKAWAEALGCDWLITGWPALYEHAGTMTSTEYAQSRGKRDLTIEVGCNTDESSAARGVEFGLRTLAHFGLIGRRPAPKKPGILRMRRLILREEAGRFVRPWANFHRVAKGELIARYDNGNEIRADEDSYIVMPFADAPVGAEWLYLAV
ncbi:MAG: succinylglutamate desuccinylase/aspartoacylase family protein [Elusimicrobia bacterium]|nr:succinylglutamate desuccinylase/aspartoacylase family protein [Elusimicrobiota bacterium]